MSTHTTKSVAAGLRISGLAVGINLLLAIGRIIAGVVGNSYALIADGIESTADLPRRPGAAKDSDPDNQPKDRPARRAPKGAAA